MEQFCVRNNLLNKPFNFHFAYKNSESVEDLNVELMADVFGRKINGSVLDIDKKKALFGLDFSKEWFDSGRGDA